MATKSARTVRFRGIPSDIGKDAFLKQVNQLRSGSSRIRLFSSPSSENSAFLTSLSSQFGYQIATVTYPTTTRKQRVLNEPNHTEWELDDEFDGLTVLHSPEDSNIDICAVHGLNGNSFDTWAHDETTMWLRDFLPKTNGFVSSRIMAFGYNSSVKASSNVSELNEWADDLLAQVGFIKQKDKRATPVIFVCHSLGGLVAREAMIRLNAFPGKYSGIELTECGILFLSTPHSGSGVADWNSFSKTLIKLFGRRSQLLDLLSPSNSHATDSREAFANMKTVPPYHCLYETMKTPITGLSSRLIVTRDSAGLNDQAASSMNDADHRTICRFASEFKSGYMLIVSKLLELKTKLLGQGDNIWIPFTLPGRPPLVAPHYPRATGKPFYEGESLRRKSRFKGRKSDMGAVEKLMAQIQSEGADAVAITGIGGIGKTEILLEIAYQRRERSNVFLIKANSLESLQNAYLHICRQIGQDILHPRHPRQDLHGIWLNMNSEEKVEAFKDWLRDPGNSGSLFIVDDLDGLDNMDMIKYALPLGANIMFSTRKPELCQGDVLECQHHKLMDMESNDICTLIRTVLGQTTYEDSEDICTPEEIQELAKASRGHPLVASHAIKYIIRELSHISGTSPAQAFLQTFESLDHAERRRFLKYQPPGTLSILDTFEVSRHRLSDPNGSAWRLMQLLSVLETRLDFFDFICNHNCDLDPAGFPDYDILTASKLEISKYLSELENVSYGVRTSASQALQFHPLWLECTRHLMGEQGRERYIRQVLLICHESMAKTTVGTFLPHLKSCLHVCTYFGIDLRQLNLPYTIFRWASEWQKYPEA